MTDASEHNSHHRRRLLLPSDFLEDVAPPLLFLPCERAGIACNVPAGDNVRRAGIGNLVLVAGAEQWDALGVARPFALA